MKPLHIVEEEIFDKATASLRYRYVLMEIDLLVLDRPPETLNKDIIVGPAATAHTNPDIPFLQPTGKLTASKLTPLIGIEDLGCG